MRKPKDINILVACEESQAVTIAFREKGFNAFSADIQESSGGYPQYHIMGDCLPLLENKHGISFTTEDGTTHTIDRWDCVIAFPPCTHLTNSGARWFQQKRIDGRQEKAIKFFNLFFKLDHIPYVSVENPHNIISGGSYIRKYFPQLVDCIHNYSQVVQPYEYGDHARKATCLWLQGLPTLKPTNIVDMGTIRNGFSVNAHATTVRYNGRCLPWGDPMVAKLRSKTYKGIASAMADQWGQFLIDNL